MKFKNRLSMQVEFSFGSPISTEILITNIYGTKMVAERVSGVQADLKCVRIGFADDLAMQNSLPTGPDRWRNSSNR